MCCKHIYVDIALKYHSLYRFLVMRYSLEKEENVNVTTAGLS